MASENTFTHTITIPLGVVDARAHVHRDGTVHLDGTEGHPLPHRLTRAAWTVLETWMVEQDDDSPMTGSTMIPMDGWRELFAHRLQPVAA